jgi:hypothetical protein
MPYLLSHGYSADRLDSREAAKKDAKVGVRYSVFGEASRGRESAGVIAVVAGPAAVFESRMNADKHSCGGAGKNLSRARARARARNRNRNRARKVLAAA